MSSLFYLKRTSCNYHTGFSPKNLIEITHNGAGISADHAAKIFNRFYRVDGEYEQTGTRLGLAVAQQMIGLAERSVKLVNPGEQGAVFQLSVIVVFRKNKESGLTDL